MVGALAQLIERSIRIAEVGGLIPPRSTRYYTFARMVELVDTYALGAYAARCAGSSPVPGTIS